MISRPPLITLHPMSWKHLQKGHPWITQDRFTEKFPKSPFLLAPNEKNKKEALLFIHDPTHPKIKARLWQKNPPEDWAVESFQSDFSTRLRQSVLKREDILRERENVYLAFGEADQLPGLFIQQLGGHLLVTSYMDFWGPYFDLLTEELIHLFPNHQGIFFQRRTLEKDKKKNYFPILRPEPQEKDQIKEFDILYELRFRDFYDIGIYTDMAEQRKKITHLLGQGQKVLNLFSYTGAFSLYALSRGADVVSVDLSPQYCDWLKKNLSLNPQLARKNHLMIQGPVRETLLKFTTLFDVIISDPPSASTDGTSKTNALKFYENHLGQMAKLLSPKGKLIIFLNTHQISRGSFEQKILEVIRTSKIALKLDSTLRLSGDCPTMSGFPEGDYLKGMILSRA